ncbi:MULTISPECIES: hypothetical protein [Bacteroides]|uniref:hypothetical protein n=1 Tax=Bacteroides TaxID=816 RepID=UPI0009328905|nr:MULTISPECIES: hypothetical protein [Bacteroides]MDC7147553.1 hypothetical protein [Bacteroides ovatus]
MRTPVFRVEKVVCYTGDKREFEDFTVLKVGQGSFCASREELEELQRQITIALNDRKETGHEDRQ